MDLDRKLQKYLSPDIYCLVHNKIVNLEQQVHKQKEIIDMFLNKVDKNKMLLNNPDLLDLYLKIKRCQND